MDEGTNIDNTRYVAKVTFSQLDLAVVSQLLKRQLQTKKEDRVREGERE